MISGIEEILFGETDFTNFEETKRCLAFQKTTDEMTKEFLKTLNEEQKKQFKDIVEHIGMTFGERETVYYKEGFKLGLKLGCEVFNE